MEDIFDDVIDINDLSADDLINTSNINIDDENLKSDIVNDANLTKKQKETLLAKKYERELFQEIATKPADINYTGDQRELESFFEYGVIPSTTNRNVDDMRYKRADNQGWLSETGRGAINVLAEGLAVGVQFIGAIPEAVKDKLGARKDRDYNNFLMEWGNNIREAGQNNFTVYQKNENTDISNVFSNDVLEYVANRAPSVASSLGMLAGTWALNKAAFGIGGKIFGSTLAKSLATKIASIGAINKIRTWGAASINRTVAAGLESGYGINRLTGTLANKRLMSMLAMSAEQATLMRIGENYTEAQQSFKNTYNEANDVFASMSDDEIAEYYENNKQELGDIGVLNRDNLSKAVARNAADLGFKINTANFASDFIQMVVLNKALGKLRSVNAGTSSTLDRNLNELGRGLTGRVIQATGHNKFWRGVKAFGEFGMLEMATEGLEEGINSIAQNEASLYGRLLLDSERDKDINNNGNTYNRYVEYLKDPATWDAMAWGALGGAVFAGGAFAAGKLRQKFKDGQYNEENARIANLQTYNTNIDALQQKMAIVDNGFNPYRPKMDNNGNILKDADGKDIYENITEEQKKELRNEIFKDALETATIQACFNGNIKYLKDYLNNKDVNDKLLEKGVIDSIDERNSDAMNEIIDNTVNLYNKHARILGRYHNALDGENFIKLEQAMGAAVTRNIISDISITENEAANVELDKKIDAAINKILNDTTIDNQTHNFFSNKDAVAAYKLSYIYKLTGQYNAQIGLLKTQLNNAVTDEEKAFAQKELDKAIQYKNEFSKNNKKLFQKYRDQYIKYENLSNLDKMYREFSIDSYFGDREFFDVEKPTFDITDKESFRNKYNELASTDSSITEDFDDSYDAFINNNKNKLLDKDTIDNLFNNNLKNSNDANVALLLQNIDEQLHRDVTIEDAKASMISNVKDYKEFAASNLDFINKALELRMNIDKQFIKSKYNDPEYRKIFESASNDSSSTLNEVDKNNAINARTELLSYLGEDSYNQFLKDIENEIKTEAEELAKQQAESEAIVRATDLELDIKHIGNLIRQSILKNSIATNDPAIIKQYIQNLVDNSNFIYEDDEKSNVIDRIYDEYVEKAIIDKQNLDSIIPIVPVAGTPVIASDDIIREIERKLENISNNENPLDLSINEVEAILDGNSDYELISHDVKKIEITNADGSKTIGYEVTPKPNSLFPGVPASKILSLEELSIKLNANNGIWIIDSKTKNPDNTIDDNIDDSDDDSKSGYIILSDGFSNKLENRNRYNTSIRDVLRLILGNKSNFNEIVTNADGTTYNAISINNIADKVIKLIGVDKGNVVYNSIMSALKELSDGNKIYFIENDFINSNTSLKQYDYKIQEYEKSKNDHSTDGYLENIINSLDERDKENAKKVLSSLKIGSKLQIKFDNSGYKLLVCAKLNNKDVIIGRLAIPFYDNRSGTKKQYKGTIRVNVNGMYFHILNSNNAKLDEFNNLLNDKNFDTLFKSLRSIFLNSFNSDNKSEYIKNELQKLSNNDVIKSLFTNNNIEFDTTNGKNIVNGLETLYNILIKNNRYGTTNEIDNIKNDALYWSSKIINNFLTMSELSSKLTKDKEAFITINGSSNPFLHTNKNELHNVNEVIGNDISTDGQVRLISDGITYKASNILDHAFSNTDSNPYNAFKTFMLVKDNMGRISTVNLYSSKLNENSKIAESFKTKLTDYFNIITTSDNENEIKNAISSINNILDQFNGIGRIKQLKTSKYSNNYYASGKNVSIYINKNAERGYFINYKIGNEERVFIYNNTKTSTKKGKEGEFVQSYVENQSKINNVLDAVINELSFRINKDDIVKNSNDEYISPINGKRYNNYSDYLLTEAYKTDLAKDENNNNFDYSDRKLYYGIASNDTTNTVLDVRTPVEESIPLDTDNSNTNNIDNTNTNDTNNNNNNNAAPAAPTGTINIKDAIAQNAIFNINELPDNVKNTLNSLIAVAEKIGIKINLTPNNSNSYDASYSNSNKLISITNRFNNLNNTNKALTIMHEITHGIIHEGNWLNNDNFKTSLNNLIADIRDVANKSNDTIPKEIFNLINGAYTNGNKIKQLEEFIAYSLFNFNYEGNVEFNKARDWLLNNKSSITVNKSLFDKFIEFLSNIFNELVPTNENKVDNNFYDVLKDILSNVQGNIIEDSASNSNVDNTSNDNSTNDDSTNNDSTNDEDSNAIYDEYGNEIKSSDSNSSLTEDEITDLSDDIMFSGYNNGITFSNTDSLINSASPEFRADLASAIATDDINFSCR